MLILSCLVPARRCIVSNLQGTTLLVIDWLNNAGIDSYPHYIKFMRHSASCENSIHCLTNWANRELLALTSTLSFLPPFLPPSLPPSLSPSLSPSLTPFLPLFRCSLQELWRHSLCEPFYPSWPIAWRAYPLTHTSRKSVGFLTRPSHLY